MPLVSPTPVSYELDAPLMQEEVITTPTMDSPNMMFPQTPNANRLNPTKYKTRLCRNLMENGYCPFEANCGFAHGDHELRDESVTSPMSPPPPPSYDSLYGSPVGSRPTTPPPQYPTRFRYEPYSVSGVAYIVD
jgi:hypothetical protein